MVVIPEAVKVWKLGFRRASIGYCDFQPPLQLPGFYHCKVLLLSGAFSCKEGGHVSFERIATQHMLRETMLAFFSPNDQDFSLIESPRKARLSNSDSDSAICSCFVRMAHRWRPDSKTVHAFPSSASIGSLHRAPEQAECLAVSRRREPARRRLAASVPVLTILVRR